MSLEQLFGLSLEAAYTCMDGLMMVWYANADDVFCRISRTNEMDSI